MRRISLSKQLIPITPFIRPRLNSNDLSRRFASRVTFLEECLNGRKPPQHRNKCKSNVRQHSECLFREERRWKNKCRDNIYFS